MSKEREVIALVYQGFLANVFRFDNNEPVRIYQNTWRGCQDFCRGCVAMGAVIVVYAFDYAGDVAAQRAFWLAGLGIDKRFLKHQGHLRGDIRRLDAEELNKRAT